MCPPPPDRFLDPGTGMDWDLIGSPVDCQQSSMFTNVVDNVSFRAIIELISMWKFLLNWMPSGLLYAGAQLQVTPPFNP